MCTCFPNAMYLRGTIVKHPTCEAKGTNLNQILNRKCIRFVLKTHRHKKHGTIANPSTFRGGQNDVSYSPHGREEGNEQTTSSQPVRYEHGGDAAEESRKIWRGRKACEADVKKRQALRDAQLP